MTGRYLRSLLLQVASNSFTEPAWSLITRSCSRWSTIFSSAIATKLGGRGKTIEIDESMFGHKRKYNRGRVGRGTWVFGMVERGTGRALAFRVPNRTRETLVTGLVQKFVEPGTTIISDKFSPYFNLNSVGYIHVGNLLVNCR